MTKKKKTDEMVRWKPWAILFKENNGTWRIQYCLTRGKVYREATPTKDLEEAKAIASDYTGIPTEEIKASDNQCPINL